MQPRLLPNLTLTGTRQIAEAKRIADDAAADRKRDEAQAAKVAEAKAALARRIRYGIAQYGMRHVFVLDRVFSLSHHDTFFARVMLAIGCPADDRGCLHTCPILHCRWLKKYG